MEVSARTRDGRGGGRGQGSARDRVTDVAAGRARVSARDRATVVAADAARGSVRGLVMDAVVLMVRDADSGVARRTVLVPDATDSQNGGLPDMSECQLSTPNERRRTSSAVSFFLRL